MKALGILFVVISSARRTVCKANSKCCVYSLKQHLSEMLLKHHREVKHSNISEFLAQYNIFTGSQDLAY